jgi:hypothetical protein
LSRNRACKAAQGDEKSSAGIASHRGTCEKGYAVLIAAEPEEAITTGHCSPILVTNAQATVPV